MKGSILQFLIFLLLFLSLIIAFCLFGYFHWYDTGYSPHSRNGIGFLQIVPSIILRFLPLSVVVSVVMSFFVTLKFRINRLVSFFLIFAGAAALYFFSFLFFADTAEKAEADLVRSAVIYPGRINPFKGNPLYAGRLNKGMVYNVIVKKGEELVYEKKVKRKELEALVLPESDPNPYYSALLSLPGFLKSFGEDLDRFNLEMKKLSASSDLYLLFSIVSQIIFAVSLWSLLRIPRWPLVAVFVSLLSIRGVFAVYSYWNTEVSINALKFISEGIIRENLFSILLILLSLIIFLLDGTVSGVRRFSKDEVQ